MPQGDKVIASQQSPVRGLGNNAVILSEHPASGHVIITFTSNFGFKEQRTLPRSWVKQSNLNASQVTFAGFVLANKGQEQDIGLIQGIPSLNPS